jgi:ABC-type multidrug transport system fused ATPase/permease subunit
MVYFFVLGVQFLAELKVSLRRIDDFLSMPEPPPPTHQRGLDQAAGAAPAAGAEAAAAGGRPSAEKRRLSFDALLGRRRSAAANGTGTVLDKEGKSSGVEVPVGGLRLGGADYDWSRNVEQLGLGPRKPTSSGGSSGSGDSSSASSGSDAGDAPEGAPAADGGVEGDAARSGREAARGAEPNGAASTPAESGASEGRSRRGRRRTLEGIELTVSPGELLGICGEVGAGKSSVLAALLGELQPIREADGSLKGERRRQRGAGGVGLPRRAGSQACARRGPPRPQLTQPSTGCWAALQGGGTG